MQVILRINSCNIESVSYTTRMKTQQAIDHFGSVNLVADAIGISHQAVYLWKGIVPKGSAAMLVIESGNKLDFGVEDYRNDAGKTTSKIPPDAANRN